MARKALTLAEEQHLMDLVIASIDRIQPETPALVERGLAISGRSRWGTWVRATKAGEALTQSWSFEKRNRLVHAWTESMIPQCNSSTARRETVPKASVPIAADPQVAKRPVTPERRARPTSAPPPGPTARVTPPVRSTGKAAGLAPNAVRVSIGNKVTYYPVTAAKSLKHGTIEHVVTSNKPYRSYPVAASAADTVVLPK